MSLVNAFVHAEREEEKLIYTHADMGTAFFVEGGGRIFFMCTWVKNGYRGGDVFGCCSLGEEGVRGGKKIFHSKENNCLLLNKKMIFPIIC